MNKQLISIINAFLDSYFAPTFIGHPNYNTDLKTIRFNNIELVSKEGKNVFIQADTVVDHSDLFNSFAGIKATFKDGRYTINGLEWDGKKTNINLFLS